MQSPSSLHVLVAGLGAIGSHLVGYLGRLGSIGRFTLVDPDLYDEHNVRSQDIEPVAAGQPKVAVQALRLARICPEAEVEAIQSHVQLVPLGQLRADLIFSCLDSRAGRQAINSRAWRLGAPWVDAGVEAGGLLARVRVFRPGNDEACLECSWSDRDYQLLKQSYTCRGAAGPEYSTGAPAPLGALAASLQALEGRKVLEGDWARVLVGREVVISAGHHRQFVSGFRPLPGCRFDHLRWNPRVLDRRPEDLTVREAFRIGGDGADPGQQLWLELEDQRFTTRLTCLECSTSFPVLQLVHTLSRFVGRCPDCGGECVSGGFDLLPGLSSQDMTPVQLALSLKDVGLRPGDIYTIRGSHGRAQFEIPYRH